MSSTDAAQPQRTEAGTRPVSWPAPVTESNGESADGLPRRAENPRGTDVGDEVERAVRQGSAAPVRKGDFVAQNRFAVEQRLVQSQWNRSRDRISGTGWAMAAPRGQRSFPSVDRIDTIRFRFVSRCHSVTSRQPATNKDVVTAGGFGRFGGGKEKKHQHQSSGGSPASRKSGSVR